MCCWYLKKIVCYAYPTATWYCHSHHRLWIEHRAAFCLCPSSHGMVSDHYLISLPLLWNTCYLFMYTKVFPSLGVVGSKSKNGCVSFMSWKEGLCYLLLELSRARRTQNKGTVKNNHIRNVNKGFFVLNHIGAFYTDRNMYPTQTTDDES